MSQISLKSVQQFEKLKICLTKIVNLNRKNRSKRPNLNKQETRVSGDSPNQILMNSGKWFYIRVFKNWPKITQNYTIIP